MPYHTDFFDLPSDFTFKRYLLHLKTKGIAFEEKNWKSYTHWYFCDADSALSKEGIRDNLQRSNMLKASIEAAKVSPSFETRKAIV
jgi:hypothetical protein